MARARRERQHVAIREEIKATARALMAEHGTEGLATRLIAREMGLTAPALYHYFASRDELITALIVDAFNALADAVQAVVTEAEARGESPTGQLRSVLLAYRAWALAHSIDFQLIYGNPIPGYEAPADLTVPAAERGLSIIAPLVARVYAEKQAHLPAQGGPVPAAVAAALQEIITREGYAIPLWPFYMTVVGWSRIHGIITLELFHHLQPVVGDVEAFYRAAIADMLAAMGDASSE